MTSKNGVSIQYNYDNMPKAINGTTFVYDYSGHRVKKNSTVYIGKLYECTSGTCTKYIFAGSNRVAIKTGSTINYYHTDHLGSSSVMTDVSGTKVEEIYYYPYGKTRSNTGTLNLKHKFTGQELDDETGLYNYGARYYDPEMGRFVSADSIVPDFSDPQSLNRYSYCRNNPVIYTDPSGHLAWWADMVIGAAVGAISAGIQSDWNGDAMLKGAGIGAVAGLVGGAVGGAMTSAGYSATVSSVGGGMAGGAAAGATAGGLNAAIYDGDIGQAMLMGGLIGGALGGIMGAINGALSETDGVGGPRSSQKELINVDPNGEQFENPIGGDMRGCDSQGCGYYGASRGGRPHLGIDVESTPGQNVHAPFGGRAYRIDSKQYPGVHLVGGKYIGDALYIKASDSIINAGTKGLMVSKGDFIGTALDITGRYPGITNHIHFQLQPTGSSLFINPTPFIFPGRR